LISLETINDVLLFCKFRAAKNAGGVYGRGPYSRVAYFVKREHQHVVLFFPEEPVRTWFFNEAPAILESINLLWKKKRAATADMEVGIAAR
jgi:hypothetical protein